MRLNQVPVGFTFIFEGTKYVHDQMGRSGSGYVAVREKETGRQTRLKGTAVVELDIEMDTTAAPATPVVEVEEPTDPAEGFGEFLDKEGETDESDSEEN